MYGRQLDLVIVACCTRYVVTLMHLVPPCHRCGEIPQYRCDTQWWLEVSA